MTPNSKIDTAERWASLYRAGLGNIHPDENLLRLIKGNYVDIPRTGLALDVGFGRGGNLVMLAQAGYEAHGLEVNQQSIDVTQEFAEQAGVNLKLGLLSGTSLPYPDAHFDLVVSWNSVYYYGNRTLVREAIEDFRRVLRPGGVLLMSVTHPKTSTMRYLSDDLGDGTRRIDRPLPYNNLLGVEIFFDGTSSGWRRLLSGFDEVEEGYTESELFNPDRRVVLRLFLARKREDSQ